MASNKRWEDSSDAVITEVVEALSQTVATGDFQEARQAIGDAIFEALRSNYETRGLELQYDNSGPNGGTSTQVRGFMKVEGQYYGFAANIYTGDRIEKPLVDRITATQKRNRLTEAIENLPPEIGSGE